MKSIPYSPYARYKRHEMTTPKSEWISHKPKKYVYHLTYGGALCYQDGYLLEKRVSIASDGLCGIDKGLPGVWVNNQIDKLQYLWPIPIDSYDVDGNSDVDYLQLYYSYDVWRIDTHAINNEWYIDPNLIDEHHFYVGGGSYDSDYLYTEKTIAPHALKLFTIDVNDYKYLYEKELPDFFRNRIMPEFDCRVPVLDFTLEPVKNINDYINLKHRLQHVRVK